MATLTAICCNPVIEQFSRRLLSVGKEKKVALIACMRKLLVIMNVMVCEQCPWQACTVVT